MHAHLLHKRWISKWVCSDNIRQRKWSLKTLANLKRFISHIQLQYSARVSLKSGGSIQLNLWDTAGQEDYDHIRALAYKDVDCFLVCFSVDSQSSFSNVKQKWIPSIIDSESSDASIVLVGTKQDLRNDKKVSSALQAKGSSFVSEQDVRRSSLFLLYLFETNHIRIHTGKKS